ncbi:MAG: twin-arginine translocase TatA/TatE family subunit [Atopobiaceae bacterium]
MNPEHLLIAALFALLLIYGPNNLPKLGSALGKTVKNVREGMDGAEGGQVQASSVAETAASTPKVQATSEVSAKASDSVEGTNE